MITLDHHELVESIIAVWKAGLATHVSDSKPVVTEEDLRRLIHTLEETIDDIAEMVDIRWKLDLIELLRFNSVSLNDRVRYMMARSEHEHISTP